MSSKKPLFFGGRRAGGVSNSASDKAVRQRGGSSGSSGSRSGSRSSRSSESLSTAPSVGSSVGSGFSSSRRRRPPSTTPSTSSVGSGSSGRRRRGPRGPPKPLSAALLASKSLAAAPSLRRASKGGPSEETVHSSLQLLLHHLRVLYNLDLVPDTEDFNKLMMLAVAEAADNTAFVGMRDYPNLEGPEGKTAHADGSRFRKPSTQHRVVTAGFQALERCATKFLETGGGRFATQLSSLATSKRQRKRAPGKALKVILRDFQLFDDASRAQRHLPTASLHGVKLPERLDDPRFSCGVLHKKQRTAGSVSIPKLQTLHATMKKLFKYAKKVGIDLAKSVVPRTSAGQGTPSSSLAKMLNCRTRASSKRAELRGGVMQNLTAALLLLQRQASSFPAAKSLVQFLEASVRRSLKAASDFCIAEAGKEMCVIASPKASCGAQSSTKPSSSESKRALRKLFADSHGAEAPQHRLDLEPAALDLADVKTASQLSAFLDSRGPPGKAASASSSSSGSSKGSGSSSGASKSTSSAASTPKARSSSISSDSRSETSGASGEAAPRAAPKAAGSRSSGSDQNSSSSDGIRSERAATRGYRFFRPAREAARASGTLSASQSRAATASPREAASKRLPSLLLRRGGPPAPSEEFQRLRDKPMPVSAIGL